MSKPARFAAHSLVAAALGVLALAPTTSDAHGFAGKRFFPATLTFDDPFPADEFDLLFERLRNTLDEVLGQPEVRAALDRRTRVAAC